MVREILKFPVQDAQRVAALQAANHAGAKSAAIRWSFIARDSAAAAQPPMARILRGGGGRGGSARLKLYLSLLWLARGRDLPVFAYPAKQLAQLLGLPDPGIAGARRVQSALKWLESAGFVALERRSGESARIHLLDDAGSGRKYESPGLLFARKGKRPAQREQHYYVRLDSEFWTLGWVAHLSGVAVAMYLAALREQRGREDESIWIAPSVGRELYDLSDESRSKGLGELVDAGLLALERRALPQDSFNEDYRARNAYRVIPNGFLKIDRPAQPGDDLEDPFFSASRRVQAASRLLS